MWFWGNFGGSKKKKKKRQFNVLDFSNLKQSCFQMFLKPKQLEKIFIHWFTHFHSLELKKKKKNRLQIFSYSRFFRTFRFDGLKKVVSNSCVQKLIETKYSVPELIILNMIGKYTLCATRDDSFGLNLAGLTLFGQCNVTTPMDMFCSLPVYSFSEL